VSVKAQIESEYCAEVAPSSTGPEVVHSFDDARFESSTDLNSRGSYLSGDHVRNATGRDPYRGLFAVTTSAACTDNFELGAERADLHGNNEQGDDVDHIAFGRRANLTCDVID
jgi:hypothetical protein